jgi:surface polysaccharide O-acyltransferase-like enzyme
MDRRLDALRVAACFLVVLLHSASKAFYAFGPRWWRSNIWDSVAPVSIPLFFMISGATLLTKTEPLSELVLKRLSRILPPLLFWSMFYLA